MSEFTKSQIDAIKTHGESIIKSIVSAATEAADASIVSYIPTGDEAKAINNERYLRRDVQTQVSEHLVETASHMPHDDRVTHSRPSVEISPHVIDMTAVGKCMKCSLLYYVNVVYTRDYANDMLTEPFDEHVVKKSESKTRDECVESDGDVVDYASGILGAILERE